MKGECLVTVKGFFAALIIVLLWVSSATAVQLSERRIPDMELNTFRSAAPFWTCATLTLMSKKIPFVLNNIFCFQRNEKSQLKKFAGLSNGLFLFHNLWNYLNSGAPNYQEGFPFLGDQHIFWVFLGKYSVIFCFDVRLGNPSVA